MTRAPARDILEALAARGWTIAVAESLTGGMVVSALVDVPGASTVVRGGVVAYATDVKRDVLGVDGSLLAARGAVDPEVARQMATGVREALGADVGVATTGVAGPEPQDGRPVGTLYIAVVTPASAAVSALELSAGSRSGVREAATSAALEACRAEL
ncbi:CinA family protein [Microbacterium koreense]|uniref:CinA family protein n=1 Tax=Microbacterium koreense TaxID=323761 RepID=A0ABW2ZTE9_9MICO